MTTHVDKQAAVRLAIEHVIANGLDDIVKPPTFLHSVELDVIQDNAQVFRSEARRRAMKFLNCANLENARIGNPQYFMMPKDEYTFRRVAWIDPFDLVNFLSVCLLLFPQIEQARSNKRLGIVHSHRQSDDPAAVFDAAYGYNSFREASSALSNQRIGGWKVITDISNFFDRIGNHPLENHLADCGCDSDMTRLVREILFQWSGDRRSFGVPIGSDASRILSEAALIAVDRQLQEREITYVRYVDDFRLFASTRMQAHEYVRQLSDILAEEGLNLNAKKTNIFQIEDNQNPPEETDSAVNVPHEVIDENERVLIRRRVQVSGRTSISRFYRHPGRDAITRLASLNFDDLLSRVRVTRGAEQEEAIRTATKYFIYVRQDVHIIATLIQAKITSIFYIVDALVKDQERINPHVKEIVKDDILVEMGGQHCSYPLQIPVLRLCAASGYEDSTLANAAVDGQRQLDSLHFFREAILLSFQQMDRQRIRRLATDIFANAAPPLQRAIAHAVKNYAGMQGQQSRPLLTNLRQTSQDWFVAKILS